MFKKRNPEALESEWAVDSGNFELAKLIRSVPTDSIEFLHGLERLAARGSNLATMMAGTIHFDGSCKNEIDAGKGREFLRRAYDAGSIEAGYRLARDFQICGKNQDAKVIFDNLSARGYGPASWRLGYGFYEGAWGEPDIDKSVDHFRKASEQGHLWAEYWMNWLLLKKVTSVGKALMHVSSIFVSRLLIEKKKLSFPNSDTLRIW